MRYASLRPVLVGVWGLNRGPGWCTPFQAVGGGNSRPPYHFARFLDMLGSIVEIVFFIGRCNIIPMVVGLAPFHTPSGLSIYPRR